MRKVPTLYLRDPENMKRVMREVNPEAAWVLYGEGVATRKYDGTCCLVRDGVLYKRYELRPGKTAPDGFEPVQTRIDYSGQERQPGWVPVGSGPEDKWHRTAWDYDGKYGEVPDGTYELCGPKIQGNPEGMQTHTLIAHATAERYPAMNNPKGYDELAIVMSTLNWEGLVWHHPDGRMAKLKRKDFPA